MTNLTRASLVLLAAAVCAGAAGPLREGDTFWHLAIGRYLLEHHRFAHPDPFVWNALPGAEDVLHEWLSELLMALVARAGLGAVRVLRALLAGAIVGVIFLAARRRSAPPLAFTAAAVSWVFLLPNLSARPHLFGLLCAALVLLLLPVETGPLPPRRRALLTGLLILWANLHSSVLLAPLLAGCHLAGRLGECAWRRRWSPDLRVWANRSAVALLATLLQPAGWRLWPYALSTPAVNREFSDEWLSLFDPRLAGDPTRLAWLLLAVALLVAVVLEARAAGDRFPGRWVALACLIFAASNRRMTAFLFLTVLYTAGVFARRVRLDLRRPLAEGWVATVALTAVAVSLPRVQLGGPPVARGAFPEETARFLRRARLEGRLFNPEAWGGYLSWALSPQYQVFADGRWPLVGRQAIADNIAVMSRSGDPEALLERHGIDVLVESTAFHLRVPGLDPRRWSLAHQDDTAVVLLRRGSLYSLDVQRACDAVIPDPAQARWPGLLVDPRGGPSPTSVPSVLDDCVRPLPGSPGR
jgi:hypothetical protein